MDHINSSNLNKALKEVRGFIEKIFVSLNDSGGNSDLTSYHNKGIRFINEDIKLQKNAIASLHNAVKGKGEEKWSYKWIEKLVDNAFYAAIDSQKKSTEEFPIRLDKQIDKLRQTLTEPLKDWEFVFGIACMRVNEKPREIGRVKFFQGDQKNIDSIHRKSSSIINKTAHTKKEKAEFNLLFAQQIAMYFKDQVIAVTHCLAGDKEAGEKLALSTVQTVLDIINFYSTFIYPKDLHIQVGLIGEVARVPFLQIAFEKNQMNMHHGHYGPSWFFEFAEFTKDFSNKNGFTRLSNILKKSILNDWEKRLFYTARIAGKAAVSRRREDAFLLYAIALESILVGGEEQKDLTFLLSLRASILLGKTRDARKKIKARVAKLYKIRSMIAHRGENNFEDSDLDDISRLTRNIIVLLLTKREFKKFTKKEQLNDWFESKILS